MPEKCPKCGADEDMRDPERYVHYRCGSYTMLNKGGNLFCEVAGCLRGQLAKVTAERDALKAIVARLPKTANGWAVTLGSSVWHPAELHRPDDDGGCGHVHVEPDSDNIERWICKFCGEDWHADTEHPLSECYSTREAAEQQGNAGTYSERGLAISEWVDADHLITEMRRQLAEKERLRAELERLRDVVCDEDRASIARCLGEQEGEG